MSTHLQPAQAQPAIPAAQVITREPTFSVSIKAQRGARWLVLHTRTGAVVAVVPYFDSAAHITACRIAETLNAAGFEWDGDRLVRGGA